MEPIAVTVRGEHRWMLIHRCTHCGRLRMNRTAADDNVLLLVQLAALPLATPPVGVAWTSAVPGGVPPEVRQPRLRDRAVRGHLGQQDRDRA